MIRASKLCRQLHIGYATLERNLLLLGKELHHPNQKISDEDEKLLIKIILHGHRPPIVEKETAKDAQKGTQPNVIAKEFVIEEVEDIPEEFEVDNPFVLEQQKMISEDDIFEGRELRDVYMNEEIVKTYLSDFEAYSICQGLENGHSKFIARQYFKNPENSENNIEAHSIAMTALSKYGSKLMSYMLTLPSLPFRAVDASQVFSELDKRRLTQSYPVLRIVFDNKHGGKEKLSISFFTEKSDNQKLRYKNVIMVKNSSTGQLLMKLTRAGVLKTEQNGKNIIPIIQTFIHFSKDTKTFIINYGLETGECSICGRELTDSVSIRRGVGPICYKNYF